jgi:uncharacterized protein YbcV (DUF1398 family)
MATTWIKPIHKSKSKSVFATLADTIGYADNPKKSNDFEFVRSFGCDYATAVNEFALAKTLYEQHTGRVRGSDDIIAFHLRQSFKPGEIEPVEALEIGYKLCEKFTHGKHQFVVAVHTDREHMHCHAIFSAVNLNCDGKFRNVRGSMRIVRQISDYLCAEHGLSIVENPQPSRGSYADWQDRKEPMTNKDKLRELIDKSIPGGMVFEQFIAAMMAAGCEVKRGKYLAFKLPSTERFIRAKSLGDDYTEQALRERCVGKRRVISAPRVTQDKPHLFIDIQEKIRQGKGAGYEHFAKLFNLKEAAKTLIYLQENGINSYEDLKRQASKSSADFRKITQEIREIDEKQKDIAELQKQIGTYQKTRATFERYRKSGWNRDFFEANRVDITLHRAAKKYFDNQNLGGKLPPIATLKQEWATLDSEKKCLYRDYYRAKDKHKDLQTALLNTEQILGMRNGQVREQEPEQQHQKSRDRDAR